MSAPAKKRPLAQTGSSMFERNLAIIVAKGRAVVLELADRDSVVGFVAGLDQTTLQLCDHKTAALSLINRDHIVSVTASDLELSSVPNALTRKEIEEKTRNFANVCSIFESK